MSAKSNRDDSSSDKKKLQGFLADLLRFGSVKGFCYFEMSLRGREELLLTVQNEQYHSSPRVIGIYPNVANTYNNLDGEDDEDSSFDFNQNLPRNYESLVLSRSTQKMLSGFHFLEIGLPPASPCQTEITVVPESATLFLLAAYARYRCPYVWVRSNHDRLVRLKGFDNQERQKIKDSPLKLKSISDWSIKDVKIWDILSEIVRINVVPSPRNPFAVDHAYFDTLPTEERIVATGAMVYFLQRILCCDHSFNSLVSQDLHEVLKKHFQDLHSLAMSQNIASVSSDVRQRNRASRSPRIEAVTDQAFINRGSPQGAYLAAYHR